MSVTPAASTLSGTLAFVPSSHAFFGVPPHDGKVIVPSAASRRRAGRAALARRAAEGQRRGERARRRAVDASPFTPIHRPTAASRSTRGCGNPAFSGRSDVQQVVAPLRCRVHQLSHERLGRLPVSSYDLNPHVSFIVMQVSQSTPLSRRGNLLLGRAEVAGVALSVLFRPSMPLRPLPTRLFTMIARLQAADVGVEILAVLFGPPVHPLAVEPEHFGVVRVTSSFSCAFM